MRAVGGRLRLQQFGLLATVLVLASACTGTPTASERAAAASPAPSVMGSVPQAGDIAVTRARFTITNHLDVEVRISVTVEPNTGWLSESPADAPPQGFNGISLKPGSSASADFPVEFVMGRVLADNAASERFTLVTHSNRMTLMGSTKLARTLWLESFAKLGKLGWHLDRRETQGSPSCHTSAPLSVPGHAQGAVMIDCSGEPGGMPHTHITLENDLRFPAEPIA